MLEITLDANLEAILEAKPKITLLVEVVNYLKGYSVRNIFFSLNIINKMIKCHYEGRRIKKEN